MKIEKKDFIKTIAPLVQKINKENNNKLFPSVVIAQAILETGWGQSNMMMKSNAIFGIKATISWKGKVYNSITKECYNGLTFTDINACFRAYDSIEESIRDYFKLILNNSRYSKAIYSESPLACITAIKNGGYATDPSYTQKIIEIIKTNNLYEYDNNTEKQTLFLIGQNYELLYNLNVRENYGTNSRIKKFNELTVNGQKNALKQENGVLKKGTIVTCQYIYPYKNEIWIKIPSGWIAGYYNNKYYLKGV